MLDPRTADTSKGQKTALQISRLTVVLDEKSISGGKGNGILFVSAPDIVCRHRFLCD